MKIKVTDIDYHRNGISGEGFWAVAFDWKDDDKQLRHMVAAVFDRPGQVAVLDAEMASEGNVTFGSNSWRGDHFENDLRLAIAEYEKDAMLL
jgi:hypothetical protein